MNALVSRLRPTPWAELSTLRKVRRIGGWVVNASLVAMAVSASTSGSEVGLRADGSRSRHDDEQVAGDPKNKAQRDQAGEQKRPADADDASEVSDAPDKADEPNASDQREAQSGNAAEDTEKAAESSSESSS